MMFLCCIWCWCRCVVLVDDVLNVVVVVVAVYDDNDVVYVVADVDFVKIIMLLYVMMFQMIKLL